MEDRTRKQQISSLNNMLQDEYISRSRLHLFGESQQEERLGLRRRQYQNQSRQIIKKGQYFPYVQSFQPVTAITKVFSRQQKEKQDQRVDLFDGLELTPISRLPKNKMIKNPERVTNKANNKFCQAIHKLSPSNQVVLNKKSKQIALKATGVQGEMLTFLSVEALKKLFTDNRVLLDSKASPEKIYKVLASFLEKNQVHINCPLIKQYRNCVYFGEQVKKDQIHQGFLIFFQSKKVYYGEMVNEKKHGKGTEIDFEFDSVYVGNFHKGRKKGQFTVIKPHQKYIGPLLQGFYCGYGKLYTNNSIYKGYFEQGCRHGQGEQYFPETRLTISGTFIYDRFTNDQNKIKQSRMTSYKSGEFKHEKESPIKQFYNPEEISHSKQLDTKGNHSFLEYEYNLRSQERTQQTRWNKSSCFRISGSKKQKKEGRKKSISEQFPLNKK